MGEIADMMREGTLCGSCGVYIDRDSDDFGLPRYCSVDCEPDSHHATPADLERDKRRQDAERRKRKAKAWRKKHRPALLDAALRYGRDPSTETLEVLVNAARTYANHPETD